VKLAAVFVLSCSAAAAHDIITTPITWSREISAIFEKKCISCHHAGGRAFAMTTYAEARPWVVAIREEILARTMPPWGAVKGFGDFANDMSLSPEEIELIVKWSEGGVPEGDSRAPLEYKDSAALALAKSGRVGVEGPLTLKKAMTLGALVATKVPERADFQITAELPDGSIVPLLWLKDYNPKFAHPFIVRGELQLPKGTTIRGVPKGASVALVPVTSSPSRR
jgi:hypothetical protein